MITQTKKSTKPANTCHLLQQILFRKVSIETVAEINLGLRVFSPPVEDYIVCFLWQLQRAGISHKIISL